MNTSTPTPSSARAPDAGASSAPLAGDAAMLCASATELARRIRGGEWTSRAVVAAHIAHARRVNPTLNAIVNDRFDQALAQAEECDAQATSAEQPFFGVPCTIKENFAFAGMPQASGLVSRRDVISDHDAPAVARIKAAGAIPLGTTNTSELCMWMESNNRVYGRTNNPYNARHIVGGSSGGEGAIIGSGASPFG
ncbi:MAG: amidase family protein, partial [Oceanococcaceae bacterium]